MIQMDSAIVVEILLAVLTCVVGAVAFFASTRANKIQATAAITAVDAEAYTRARQIYEGALGTLQGEVEDLRKEIVRLRQSNERMSMELHEMKRRPTHPLADEDGSGTRGSE